MVTKLWDKISLKNLVHVLKGLQRNAKAYRIAGGCNPKRNTSYGINVI